MVIAEISAFPIGKGESLSEPVAEVVKVIKDSGLKYHFGPMGTAVEGEWNEVMEMVGKCREVLIQSNNRIYMVLKIDERKNKKHHIRHKIKAVEEKL